MRRKREPEVVYVEVRRKRRRGGIKSLLGAVILLAIIGAIANNANMQQGSGTSMAAGPTDTAAPSDTPAPADTPVPTDTPSVAYSSQTVTLVNFTQRIGVGTNMITTVQNTGPAMPDATILYQGLDAWTVVGVKSTCGTARSYTFGPEPGYAMGPIPSGGVCTMELDVIPQKQDLHSLDLETLASPDLGTQAGGKSTEHLEITVLP